MPTGRLRQPSASAVVGARRRRSSSSAAVGLGRVDLALHRPRAMRICDVLVDLQPHDVAVEAGDEPVHAGRGHHLVADRSIDAAGPAAPAAVAAAGGSSGSTSPRDEQRRSASMNDAAPPPSLSSAATTAARESASIATNPDEVSAGRRRTSTQAGGRGAHPRRRARLAARRRTCQRRSRAGIRAISCSVQATLCMLTRRERGRLADLEQVADVARGCGGRTRRSAQSASIGSSLRACSAFLIVQLARRRSAPCRGGRGGSASRSRTGRRRARPPRPATPGRRRPSGSAAGRRAGASIAAASAGSISARVSPTRQPADAVSVEVEVDGPLGAARRASPRRRHPGRCRTAPGRSRRVRRAGPLGPRRRALDRHARRPRAATAAAGTRRAPSGCRRRAAPAWPRRLRREAVRSSRRRCCRNVTPSSSTFGSSENTWKPPRVGQRQPAPSGEPAEPAERGDRLGAGPQHQVVRVAEHDLGAELLVVGGAEVLDRAAGADGHEARRAVGAACRARRRRARAAPSAAIDGERDGVHQAALRSSSIASPKDKKR